MILLLFLFLFFLIIMKKLILHPFEKISFHIDFLFGRGISSLLPRDLCVEYSRKTGRIKNFSIDEKLIGTFRTDGGIALTIYGAQYFLKNTNFLSNCIIPIEDAIPFVMEGRSLFIRHVYKCGPNIKCGSDVVIIDNQNNVIAVGHSLFSYQYYSNLGYDRSFLRGVGVKIREGIKSRST